jgi:hypothetical protein
LTGIIIWLSGNALCTASCIIGHSDNPPTIRIFDTICDTPFVDLLETVFFIKVMMLSIVDVFIIKSALNFNLSPHRVISFTYDDESMADFKSLPCNSLHISFKDNGNFNVITFVFDVLKL